MSGTHEASVLPSLAPHFLPLLLDCAWKAAVLLAATAMVACLLRRHSAATRHSVWTAALVAALLLPVGAAVLPGWHLLPSTWQELTEPVAQSAVPEQLTMAATYQPDADVLMTPTDDTRITSNPFADGVDNGLAISDAEQANALHNSSSIDNAIADQVLQDQPD